MHNTNKMLMRFGIRPKLHFRYISYKVHDSKVELGPWGKQSEKREIFVLLLFNKNQTDPPQTTIQTNKLMPLPGKQKNKN